MENNLNFFENGGRPNIFGKIEDDLIFWQMEDNLN